MDLGHRRQGRELKASTPGPAFEADHGLIVTRSVTVSAETDWLTKQHRWPALKGIGKMVRARETADNTSIEKPGLGLAGQGSTEVELCPGRLFYTNRRRNAPPILSRPVPSSRRVDGSGVITGGVVEVVA